MRNLLVIINLVVFQKVSSQEIPLEYFKYTKLADSCYLVKDYLNSANNFSKAFQANGWKGISGDRYNAACSWALINNIDSAFFQLNRIAFLSYYSNYDHITSDTDLVSLYNDTRWNAIIIQVSKNKDKEEEKYNKPLKAELDMIRTTDQEHRKKIGEFRKIYKNDSKEMDSLWNLISFVDSINLLKVEKILNEHGWLGADVVGQSGNSALFLVIQHSNQEVQEKYLPMMRTAAKEGRANTASLAMLEDRVALGQNKCQIYGSQIGTDVDTNLPVVLPLLDPDNVNKRRSDVGLPSIEEYLKNWEMIWDIEKYKKELPSLKIKMKIL